VCPLEDCVIFKSNIPDAIIIAEEDILKKTNLNLGEYRELSGWKQQQIIKMIFGYYINVENYVTIDSDVIFLKSFTDNVFFKGNTVKTLCFKHKLSLKKENRSIDDILRLSHSTKALIYSRKLYFVTAYQLWNVKLLIELEKYIKETELKDLIGMINFHPYEALWYGKYVYQYHKNLFIPQKPVFFNITGSTFSEKSNIYKNKALIYLEYFRKIKYKSIVGGYLQYNSGSRDVSTLADIVLEFKNIKTSIFIKNMIFFFSLVFRNKFKRMNFRGKLADIYLRSLLKS
jgi:hypothetical protein